jgi:phage-related minor tail protein
MDVPDIITVIGGIVSISIAVTGIAVWTLRTATTDMKRNLDLSTEALRESFKEFTKGVDAKLDNFHLHVDKKVEGVNTHVRDISLRSDALTDRIHLAEREYLIFRSELNEQYVSRREMDELRKRVTRLEPDPHH